MKVKTVPTLFLTSKEQSALRNELHRSAQPCLFVNCPEINCDECPFHKANEAYKAYKHELEAVLKNCITEEEEDD